MTDSPVLLSPLAEDWQEVELPFAKMVRSFVSGDPHGERIRVRYFRTPEPNILKGRIWFGPAAEGPPGHAHGGAQAAALDEICGGAVWVHGHQVVALNLVTDFVAFVPLRTELVLHAAITRQEGRKLYTEGRLEDVGGKVLAKGRVLFIELNSTQLGKLAASAGISEGD